MMKTEIEKRYSGLTKQTAGVKTLLGAPKKAIIKLSLPMIAAMSAHTIYNLVDAIWVSGEGADSLSAVGFTFPFLFLLMAIANGIGIGSGTAISRRIGAQDKEGADTIASHGIIIMLIFSLIFTIVMLLCSEFIIKKMGAGTALNLSLTYARIQFSGIIFLFFFQVALALLRSEGDAKKAMYPMVGGAILNIILDPLFIYTFGLGVAGAAYATILSMAISCIFPFYWLFIQKKTFVEFHFRGFTFQKEILLDISRVAFPASVSQMSMALMAFALTTIVARAAGPGGVAVFTTGWRVLSLATLPMLGVATAVASVSGAAYGAGDYNKLSISYMFAIKTGVFIEIIFGIIIFLLVDEIAWIFTWSVKSSVIVDNLLIFLKIHSIFCPTVAFGMLSSAMFMGAGKGINALFITLIRTLLLTVPLAWLGGKVASIALTGIWIGIVAAALLSSPVAFGWALMYIRKLKRSQFYSS